jgi:hypothetical protein
MYHPGICLEELRKTTKTISKDILVPAAPDISVEPYRYAYLLSGLVNAKRMNCVRNIHGRGDAFGMFLSKSHEMRFLRDWSISNEMVL